MSYHLPAIFRTNRYLLPVLILTLLLICSVGAALRVKVFNSDDAVYQVLAHTLSHRTGVTYIASDTFIFKTWTYALIPNQLNSRLLLSMTGIIFTLVGFAFYLYSYFLITNTKQDSPSTRLSWWPLLWLVSLGYFFMSMLIAPNTRNVELGLDFLTLFMCGYMLGKPVNYLQLAGLYVWCGLLSFNDPYFMYFFLFPLILWSLLLLAIHRSKAYLSALALASALLAFSWASIFLLEIIMRRFHIIVANNHPFVLNPLGELPAHLELFFLSLTRIIGIDSPAHGPYALISVVILVGYSTLLAYLLYKAASIRSVKRLLGNHFLPLLAIQLVTVACVFIFTSASSDLGTARYLVAIPFAFALALGIALRNGLVKVVYIAACLTIVVSANTMRSALIIFAPVSSPALQQTVAQLPFNIPGGADATNNLGNAENEQIAQMIKASGYSKGYAEYWQAPINAYFSQGVTILNLYCANSTLKPHLFLINTAMSDIWARQSFFIADKRSTDCNNVLAQLKPVKQVETNSFRILFFDYDIGQHLLDN